MLKKEVKKLFSKHPKEFPNILKKYWDILGKLKNENGWTMLHCMTRFFEHVNEDRNIAMGFLKEVFKHPDISIVKNNAGWTPLHQIASFHYRFCLSHPNINKVKDNAGKTPLDAFNFKLKLKEKQND